MVAAVLHLDEGAGAALEAVDQMRGGLAHRHDVVDRDARLLSAARARNVAGSSFSALPSTRSTSGMAAKAAGIDLRGAAGDDDAARPGRSRRALRIAWRAWRTASAVTAQVLTMTASPSPAAARVPRITSHS